MCVYSYVCMYVYVCVCMCVRVRVCLGVCVCVYLGSLLELLDQLLFALCRAGLRV
jgi:hypothetical protein